MDIFESLSGVFSCMLMIGLGYWLTHRGWFTEETGRLFSRMAMAIAIPLYLIVSMTKSYTRQDLVQLGVAVLVPLVVIVTCWLAGALASRLVDVPAHRRGAFRAMFFAANSAFIGFPVNVALFGEKALPYAVMYYLVQTLWFWTVGAHGLGVDGARIAAAAAGDQHATVKKPSGRQLVRNILSPPLVSALVAILLILLDVRLPTVLRTTFGYLGGMSTPLTMLFLGIAIYVVQLRSLRLTRDMWVLVAARFLLAPAVVIAVTAVIPVSDLMRNVFVVEAAMPVMAQVGIAARAYGADANYVAVLTAITTVMALFTIPAYFLLLTFGVL